MSTPMPFNTAKFNEIQNEAMEVPEIIEDIIELIPTMTLGQITSLRVHSIYIQAKANHLDDLLAQRQKALRKAGADPFI